MWNTELNGFQVTVCNEVLLNHTTCSASDKRLYIAQPLLSLFFECTGVYALAVCLLWSVSRMHADTAGCYGVHAEQNKQKQHCTLRIFSVQQHQVFWRNSGKKHFLLETFFVVSFILSIEAAEWTLLHVLGIFVFI